MFSNCNTTQKKHLGFDSTHNIKTNNTKVIKSNYSEYLPARIYVTLFFFQYLTENHNSSFWNRTFSIIRISCSRSGRFYFRVRTEACAVQPEPQDFCGRDLMSPESFQRCPLTKKPEDSGYEIDIEPKSSVKCVAADQIKGSCQNYWGTRSLPMLRHCVVSSHTLTVV